MILQEKTLNWIKLKRQTKSFPSKEMKILPSGIKYIQMSFISNDFLT